MNRLSVWVFGVAACLSLALAGGCAKPEIVPSKGPRMATSADQVKIYEKQPMKYEVLGTVTTTAAEGAKWDERGNADAGFNNMKAKAAALGANGLLLMADPGEFDRHATAGYSGTFYQVPLRGKPAVAVTKAIFVLEE